MGAVVLSLLSVVLVSLVSLVGLVTLSMGEPRLRSVTAVLLSFAVGALLGDAFIHLIPEIFAEAEPKSLVSSLWILGGMLLFFVVEKLLRHEHGVLYAHFHGAASLKKPELAAINLIGDGIHNFIDGVLIGASYLVSVPLGASTTLAIVLHEVPQELGDFGVLVHSGLTVKKAALLNLASGAVAVLGTLAALLFGAQAGQHAARAVLPVAAGGFVYLATADLIPELQHDRSARGALIQTGCIALGVAVMGLVKLGE